MSGCLHMLQVQLPVSISHLLWKHEPGIQHNIPVIVPDQHAIHADFAEPANRKDPQWGPWELQVNNATHFPLRAVISTPARSVWGGSVLALGTRCIHGIEAMVHSIRGR